MCQEDQPRRRRQVCLFGTSANPPTGHGGHLGIVQALAQMDRFDEIRVLPVYQHTFSSKRNQLVSYQHRMNMCRIAFQGMATTTTTGNTVFVSDAEERSFQRKAMGLTQQEMAELRVGTADLLDLLRQEEPNTDFSFCLGGDTFLDLTAWKWQRSKDVLELLEGRLVVLHRSGTEGRAVEERRNAVNNEQGGKVVLLDVDGLGDVSSSLVRSCTDETKLLTMLHPGVLKYIQEEGLYSFADVSEAR